MSKSCFIIAPITTPDERLSLYGNDREHCRHIIEHLLIPAVEAAGMKPIAPMAKGAELILAEIVTRLQDAELVLCDMSGLNPNVFFELGIRTAMNRPVCVVRDELTKVTPFDMTPINSHTYNSNLAPWVTPHEIESMAAHIRQSSRAADNALWKYFGLKITAAPAAGDHGPEAKMDLLFGEFEALRRQLTAREALASAPEISTTSEGPDGLKHYSEAERWRIITERMNRIAARSGLHLYDVKPAEAPGGVQVVVSPDHMNHPGIVELDRAARQLGYALYVGLTESL